jgi:DNA-binding XRE family transcriptional regulator
MSGKTKATKGKVKDVEKANGDIQPVVPEGWTPRYAFEPVPGEIGMGPDELEAIGEIGKAGDTPPQGMVFEMISLVNRLKARREAKGLSLTDVSERSGLTRQVISKLENGRTINPTVGTLYRYALALDAGVTLDLEEVEPDEDR